MTRTITTLLIVCCATVLKAQVSVGYFPFNHSMVQVTSDPERRVFADLRLQTNSFVSNTNIELSPFVNLRRRMVVNYYCGAGISLNPFNEISSLYLVNGYFITAGARIKPLSANRNAAIIFELSPYAERSFKSGMIRSALGIAYAFGKGKKRDSPQ